MAARMSVRLLGPLEVEVAGTAIPVTSQSQRLLLVALALAGGRPLAADQLAEVLWGDQPPPSLTNSLQSHLTRLRTVLGDAELVARQPPGYRLDVTPDAVDLHLADRLVSRARDAEDDAALPLLDEALALWRGDDLAGLDDHPFVADHEHARVLRVDALEARGRQHLHRGDHAAAVRDLDQATAAEPLRSSAVALQLRALAAAGRVADADAAYQRHRRDLADDLGLDPPAALQDVHTALLRDELPDLAPPRPDPGSGPAERRPVPHRPPRPRTALLGRDAELAAVHDHFGGAPVVTIVGPGGVGKTHLSLEFADQLGRDRPVRWVDLADAHTAEEVEGRVALVANTASSGEGVSTARLADALGNDPQVLVLDNCEQATAAVGALVADLSAFLPGLQVLATSRESLGVSGERLVRLAPLPTDGTDSPAVTLFLDRVGTEALDPDDPTQLRLARDVVEHVDGLPLAIELAARQVANLGLGAVHARLDDHLDLLVGRQPEHPAHGDLRTLVRWSTATLDDEQRMALGALSAFAGEFTLDVAEQLLSGAGFETPRVAVTVATLVDRSLVLRVPGGRHRLLDTIRAVAREEAAAAGTWDTFRGAHVDTMTTLLTDENPALRGPGEPGAVQRLNDVLADLQAAVATVETLGDPTRAAALARAVRRYAYHTQRVELLAVGRVATDLVAPDATPALRAGAWLTDAAHALCRGDFDRAREQARAVIRTSSPDDDVVGCAWQIIGDVELFTGAADEATAAYRCQLDVTAAGGDEWWHTEGLVGLSLVRAYIGDREKGLAVATRLWDRARALGNPTMLAWAHYARAELLADHDPTRAIEEVERAVSVAATVDNHLIGGVARSARSAIRARHGDPTDALVDYRSALQHWQRDPNPTLQTTVLRNLGVLLARIGHDETAALLDGAAGDDTTLFPAEQRRVQRARDMVDARLGPERARRLRESARHLTMERLVEIALDAVDTAAESATTGPSDPRD